MKLVLISFPKFFKGEAEVLTQLLEKYEFTLYVRKPEVNGADYRKLLQKIPENLHRKIVIHNASKLLKEYDLKGIHLSTKNRIDKDKIEGVKVLSTSCHSFEEVDNLSSDFTHCFLSPVFPSISKKGYDDVLNRVELISFLKKERKLKIIGLGGIQANSINELKKCQFDGYGVLGAVWTDKPENNGRIESNFQKIYECIKNDHTV